MPESNFMDGFRVASIVVECYIIPERYRCSSLKGLLHRRFRGFEGAKKVYVFHRCKIVVSSDWRDLNPYFGGIGRLTLACALFEWPDLSEKGTDVRAVPRKNIAKFSGAGLLIFTISTTGALFDSCRCQKGRWYPSSSTKKNSQTFGR